MNANLETMFHLNRKDVERKLRYHLKVQAAKEGQTLSPRRPSLRQLFFHQT